MIPARTRCLILACGNTLRGDDGVGPWLAQWAEARFRDNPTVRIHSRHLWTPELAREIAEADAVLFVDSSADSAPGAVQLLPVERAGSMGIATHHLGPDQLLGLCHELYATEPLRACLLTVGLASTELGAAFSDTVQQALPQACSLLESAVEELLAANQRS